MSVASSVTFATTAMGTRATKTLTVSNLSTSSTLSVDIGTLGAPFAVSASGSHNIAPGGHPQLTITFTPSQVGTASQNLIITSSDPHNPKVTVQVVGNGGKSR
jgi:hypothetical protein